MKYNRMNLVLKPEMAALYISLSELAKNFDINYKTLYNRFVSQGKVQVTRFGNHYYFKRSDMPLLIQIGTAPVYKGGPRK